MSAPEFDCDIRCRACQHIWCAQADVSPGEADGICRSCWETDAPAETEAEVDAAYEAWLRMGFPA